MLFSKVEANKMFFDSCKTGKDTLVKYLIEENEISINLINEENENGLHIAVKNNQLKICSFVNLIKLKLLKI